MEASIPHIPASWDPAASGEGGVLRFLTCGSVDDGKSTLIGRLLLDSKLVLDDHLAALARDSQRYGTTGEDLDPALLLDGLEAEREQGITIDVAYRYFSTPRRKFIVADTPGHAQYTRNMVSGASTADLAVILVDACHGIVPQTRRHMFLVALLGIRHVILAINKMDRVNFSQGVFDDIQWAFTPLTKDAGFESVTALPVCAKAGDNICRTSERMPWYTGPTLLHLLETCPITSRAKTKPFRMAVQSVNRPDPDFRGFAGTVASGTLRPGEKLTVATRGTTATLARIVTQDGDLAEACAGDSVLLTFAEEMDISRGDLLCKPHERPEVAEQFAAKLVWMDQADLVMGRSYLLKCGTRTVNANITHLSYKLDVNTQERLPAQTLSLNDIGRVKIAAAQAIAFDPYAENRETGAFILIDRTSNATVAAGMIQHPMRRATNVVWQSINVTPEARAQQKGQRAAVVWLTGLSGAGKSTIANLVEQKLYATGRHSYLLDADNIRHGINRDLGFTEADRIENIRRIGEMARLMAEAGLLVLVSCIAPYRAERANLRERLAPFEMVEIFVDSPLEDCIARDVKGLYAKALSGNIPNFTGISSPYEPPLDPTLHIDTRAQTAEQAADLIVDYLSRHFVQERPT